MIENKYKPVNHKVYTSSRFFALKPQKYIYVDCIGSISIVCYSKILIFPKQSKCFPYLHTILNLSYSSIRTFYTLVIFFTSFHFILILCVLLFACLPSILGFYSFILFFSCFLHNETRKFLKFGLFNTILLILK